MKKYLDGYAEWVPPEAGMFFWCVKRQSIYGPTLFPNLGLTIYRFKLILNKESDGKKLDEGDSDVVIRTKAFEKGVLALPGSTFIPNGGRSPYVRASFSLNPEEEVFEALRRLRLALEEV